MVFPKTLSTKPGNHINPASDEDTVVEIHQHGFTILTRIPTKWAHVSYKWGYGTP